MTIKEQIESLLIAEGVPPYILIIVTDGTDIELSSNIDSEHILVETLEAAIDTVETPDHREVRRSH